MDHSTWSPQKIRQREARLVPTAMKYHERVSHRTPAQQDCRKQQEDAELEIVQLKSENTKLKQAIKQSSKSSLTAGSTGATASFRGSNLSYNRLP
eukprot:196461-Prymnesium_polylepis.1